MADVKLPPAECEQWAQDAMETSGMCEPDHAAFLLRVAASHRLAARALRARELIRGALDHGGDTPEVDQVLTHLLAILEGREP